MTTFVQILESIGVFTAGALARVGVFLVMLALLVLPALLLAFALRAAGARRERRLGIREVAGIPFRPDLRYAPGHLWLHARKGGAVEIGLDGLAQRLVPSVTGVELPRPGTRLARGERLAVLHGGGRALEVPSPVDGVVAGVNASVVRDPSLVKREGYGRGWLVALSPTGDDAARMPAGAEAEGWMAGEAARWNRHLEDRLGFAAADGGTLVAPAPWLVGEEGWRELVRAFLRPSLER